MTPDERERYRRQLLWPGVGGQGQQALAAAHVVVIGAGGLGCPIIAALAAAGVGRLTICDGDTVARSNLNRQTLYGPDDIDQPKADCAARWIQRFNPHLHVHAVRDFLTGDNAQELVADAALVIEGLDRFAPRYLVNAACRARRKPWISAAVGLQSGQVVMFDPARPHSPCYGCLVPAPPTDEALCEAQGMIGTLTGIVGNLAAHRAIEWICGDDAQRDAQIGRLSIFDVTSGRIRNVTLPRDPDCDHCAPSP